MESDKFGIAMILQRRVFGPLRAELPGSMRNFLARLNEFMVHPIENIEIDSIGLKIMN